MSSRTENEILGRLPGKTALTGWECIAISSEGCDDWWRIQLFFTVCLGQTDSHLSEYLMGYFSPSLRSRLRPLQPPPRPGPGSQPACSRWDFAADFADFAALLSLHPTSFLLWPHDVQKATKNTTVGLWMLLIQLVLGLTMYVSASTRVPNAVIFLQVA